jgi:hypothetical protein
MAPSTGIKRSASLPMPAMSSAFAMQLWAATEVYAASFFELAATPAQRTSKPKLGIAGDQHADEVGHRGPGDEQAAGALRKTEDPPHPADDLALHFDGAWSRPPRLAFSPAASISASIPTGVPPPCTQPMKPGCTLPAA